MKTYLFAARVKTVSVTPIYRDERQDDEWRMILYERGRKLSRWNPRVYHPGNCLQGLRYHNTSVRTFGLRAVALGRDGPCNTMFRTSGRQTGERTNLQAGRVTSHRDQQRILSPQAHTFSNKSIMHQPTVIKCCWYILRGLATAVGNHTRNANTKEIETFFFFGCWYLVISHKIRDLWQFKDVLYATSPQVIVVMCDPRSLLRNNMFNDLSRHCCPTMCTNNGDQGFPLLRKAVPRPRRLSTPVDRQTDTQ